MCCHVAAHSSPLRDEDVITRQNPNCFGASPTTRQPPRHLFTGSSTTQWQECFHSRINEWKSQETPRWEQEQTRSQIPAETRRLWRSTAAKPKHPPLSEWDQKMRETNTCVTWELNLSFMRILTFSKKLTFSTSVANRGRVRPKL